MIVAGNVAMVAAGNGNTVATEFPAAVVRADSAVEAMAATGTGGQVGDGVPE